MAAPTNLRDGPCASSFRSVKPWSRFRSVAGGFCVGAAVALLTSVPVAEIAHAAGCPAGMANIQGRYCVDRYEASVDVVSDRGETLRRHSPFHTPERDVRIRARSRGGVKPQAYISMERAREACEVAGKRLCTDAEWVTACKGKRPTLYPYGEEHQYGRCNDNGTSPLRMLHGKDDSVATFGYQAMNDPRLNQVPGTLAATGQFARCRNSYGLYDMVGNLHEWTANPSGVFRGGYYLDTHIHGQGCEYQTTGHSPRYHDYSTGFRCCKSLVAGTTTTMPTPTTQRAKPQQKLGPGERQYEVVGGDSLSAIARRHRVTVTAVCERNRISRDTPLQLGQRLVIPRPAPGDEGVATDQKLAPGERRHEVEAGQTLGGIARRYRVSVAAVCERNAIERNHPIRPGQQLIIPRPR